MYFPKVFKSFLGILSVRLGQNLLTRKMLLKMFICHFSL